MILKGVLKAELATFVVSQIVNVAQFLVGYVLDVSAVHICGLSAREHSGKISAVGDCTGCIMFLRLKHKKGMFLTIN
jgi:hypothetical protein